MARTCVEVLARLRADLVQGRERRAGQLELAAGLQRDRRRRLAVGPLQRDDVVAFA